VFSSENGAGRRVADDIEIRKSNANNQKMKTPRSAAESSLCFQQFTTILPRCEACRTRIERKRSSEAGLRVYDLLFGGGVDRDRPRNSARADRKVPPWRRRAPAPALSRSPSTGGSEDFRLGGRRAPCEIELGPPMTIEAHASAELARRSKAMFRIFGTVPIVAPLHQRSKTVPRMRDRRSMVSTCRSCIRSWRDATPRRGRCLAQTS
jgi:hypothetical protein